MLAMPEDLSDLEVLDENSILQALRNRFYNDNFYTYIGEILLAVNPCRPLASFEEKVHIEYENVVNRKQRPPHLFWTANFAYGSLVETGRNQCILVSGESGAGKTESTKYMIRHLMRVSPSQDKSLLHKIVQVNPLLEAFGNAATTMNTNSSRFGKFVELHYSDNNQLLGAKIDDYILEKSRVVHRNKGEQNFHVFYALFAGMPRDRLLYYFLEDPDCHRIMRDEDPGNGVFRDSEEFQLYKKMFSDLTVIMSEIGFCEEHISVIFLILASILHLANIVFMPCEETDGVTVVDEYPLHAVAKLLGIEDEVELTEALISNVNFIKGERIQSWRNLREANDNRDALAKDLYSRLFGWIVGQVNRNLWQNRMQNISQRSSTIGLLDMSGFENFAKNSFDQFLINISNEKLQQYFMDYIFPRERREYELEAVEWRDIIYHSNDEVLDLLFRRPDGVLSLLDEESLFPQSNDFTFVHKLDQYCKDNSRYICSVGRNGAFGIRHYAESVEYDSDGFLERNRDNLSQDLVHCLLNSTNDFIKDLFTASMSPTGTISDYASRCSSRPKLPCAWPSTIEPECLRESLSRQASLKIKRSRGLSGDSIASSVGGRNSPTVTKHFKRSLSDLMTKLSQAQPLFVRCIKPNQALSPTNFDPDLVQRQLLCNGLMEIAELRRDGYPVRIKYEDFVKKYEEIFDFSLGHLDSLGLTNEILKSCNIDGYNFGRTKVFLKHRHKDVLDEHLRKKHMEKELCRIKEEKSKSLISGGNAMSLLTVPNQLSTQRNSADSGLDLHVRGLDDLGNRGAADNDGSIATTPPFDAASSFLDKMDAEESTFPVKNRPSDLIGTETTTTSENLDEDVDQWRPYDIFQVSEREFEDNDYIFKEILKGIRLFLYFFIVVAVLACVMASKLSLLLLTSGINKDENSRGQHLVMILFCLCAPIAWNWFMALMKTLFGGKEWPSMLTFFVLMILECSETLGICLMLFRVLPSTDFFRGLVTTMAICQIPSLLKVVVHEKRPNLSIAEIVTIIMNVLAFLVQGASIPFFNIVDFIKEGNYTILEGHNETSYFEAHVIVSNKLEWELPLALILISLGYWENYVSGEWCIFGKLTIPFKKWRSILQDVRETSYVLVAPFKIGLAVLLSRLLTGNTDFVFPATENFNASTSRFQSRAQEVGVSYSLVFIQIGTGVICTYLAGLACKLHMQRTAFAFPLIMGPPAALIFVYFQCEYQFLPAQWHVGGWFCANQNLQNMLIPMICAFLLWLSYAITVSHIWFPQSERMAKIEKLFVTPHFNAVFPDFTLTLRRRRNDKEVKLTGFDTFRYVGDDVYGSEDLYNSGKNVTPKVYVCATMWHETKQEMTQLLKSLFRLDYVHCASRLAQEKFKIQDPDYFDLEMHVIFDDAFELDEKVDKFVPNMFVKQLIECMEDAARSVVKGPICISPPERVPTPYGGRLIWTMPGHTKMVVHIKNKNKIRHRKRWSQVMYLYYLLGYRLLGVKESEKIIMEEGESTISKVRNRKKGKKALRSRPLKRLFTRMDPEQYEQAESTFILTLDGDVDFRPDSVKLLIDRMKKNRKVGAVCGRIHPIGSGPMVWYQQFEYAVGHWLQKAAEHVFGCVLCCPGCFSLFRGSAIMDDNVLKMYTTKPTEARHYIQFEQGEDRWLCTLLLQQGHKIDYCAGADALTFAPETFNEFFNQRRRWSPSTLANMMDLLSSWRDTTRINDNISRPYILYQFVLMASTILAPSTVILMITGSYHSVLKLGIWESYILSLLPVLIYLGICMYFKSDTQIMAAAVLTALYSIVMMIATVGTIVSIVTENFGSPNVVFLTGLVAIFTLAGIIHPQEFFCLVYGALYFMVVPSTFILLTVYYLCNLNNVSWGTRETPKKLTKEEEEELKRQQEEKKKKKESKSIFNKLGITNLINEVRDLIRGIIGTKIEKAVSEVAVQTETSDEFERKLSKLSRHSELSRPSVVRPEMIIDEVTPTGWEADPDNPYWLSLEYLGKGDIKYISGEEEIFWQFMIKKYLHPLDEDQQHKEKIKKDLESLKNNVVFIYFMINFLWTVITLQLQSMEDELKNFYIINKYEPLSLIFLSVFAIAISLQFFSMFVHRWGTFLHLMSSTRIDWFKKVHTEEDFVRFVVNEAQRLQRLEPEPDYDDLPPDYDDDYIVSPGSEQYDELPSLPQSPNGTARMHRKSNKRTFASDTHEIPLLQQIFEDRLENMHRQWRQGTLAFRPPNNMRSLGIDRHDSKRFSERENQMRQKMFKRSFKKKSSEEESNEKKDNDAVKIDILNL